MLRNLTANLVLNERILTTEAKAKELRRVAERLITKAKRLGPAAYTPHADLSATDRAKRLAVERLVASYIPRFGVRTEDADSFTRVDLVEKVLVELAKRFSGRPGGYTRAVKTGPRRGDNARMSLVEFVSDREASKGGDKKTKVSPKKVRSATASEPTTPSKAE